MLRIPVLNRLNVDSDLTQEVPFLKVLKEIIAFVSYKIVKFATETQIVLYKTDLNYLVPVLKTVFRTFVLNFKDSDR